MTMRDLVLLAGGLEESAYLTEAEIARLPESRARGVTAETTRTPLDSSYLFERGPDGHYQGPPGLPARTGEAPDVALRPYDNVLILRQPDWELQRNVAVTGEVRFPGRYALVNKNEKLADVVARAGGLTAEAYAAGGVFVRHRNDVGRVGIDLPTALKDRHARDNLLLQDGDSLFIPRFNAVVTVSGSVNSPVNIAFVPGATIDYYIRAAGGAAPNADVRRAYVTQPNGRVEGVERRFLLPDGVPRPRAGSRVFVPARDPQARAQFLALAGSLTQILSTLVTVSLAVIAATR
jgi:polysaccharide biosynthesis/export protein